MRKPVFLLVASFPDSLIKFRGPLIEVLIKAGCQVHVAVPGLEAESDIASRLTGLGVTVHDIPLKGLCLHGENASPAMPATPAICDTLPRGRTEPGRNSAMIHKIKQPAP